MWTHTSLLREHGERLYYRDRNYIELGSYQLLATLRSVEIFPRLVQTSLSHQEEFKQRILVILPLVVLVCWTRC